MYGLSMTVSYISSQQLLPWVHSRGSTWQPILHEQIHTLVAQLHQESSPSGGQQSGFQAI
jgi:hypothetical protein